MFKQLTELVANLLFLVRDTRVEPSWLREVDGGGGLKARRTPRRGEI
jgi:hypothetical protein